MIFNVGLRPFGGIFDLEVKRERLEEVNRELEQPEIWNDPERAQAIGKEKAQLEKVVLSFDELLQGLQDNQELLQMVVAEEDDAAFNDIVQGVADIEKHIERLEFQKMFSGKLDSHDAYLEIQSGSGGTEAQDWAEMLLRMYLRWGESKGFTMTVLEASDGEVAGIKGATVKVEGDHAFGWLRTETGVHRLVRKSPFDSGNRRHTSFAAVFVSPVIDDSIDIDINPADLRIDTYRASGAGGQHVNRTDSAVRITHQPSGIVVQCQNDRSQHKNKAQAMSQLKAKLYEMEQKKRMVDQQALEDSKSDIGWGSQIRSYVLDDSRIKDLRTGVETTNIQSMLDGNLLDKFMTASLQHGL